jgi:hypothetical protein
MISATIREYNRPADFFARAREFIPDQRLFILIRGTLPALLRQGASGDAA